jgi:hypothetical protein
MRIGSGAAILSIGARPDGEARPCRAPSRFVAPLTGCTVRPRRFFRREETSHFFPVGTIADAPTFSDVITAVRHAPKGGAERQNPEPSDFLVAPVQGRHNQYSVPGRGPFRKRRRRHQINQLSRETSAINAARRRLVSRIPSKAVPVGATPNMRADMDMMTSTCSSPTSAALRTDR